MGAYLRRIHRPKCWCGKNATVTLYNTFNAPGLSYCARHGREALRKFKEEHGQ